MPIEPFVPAKPGDPILAEKWNEIQVKIRTQLEDLSANKFNAAGGTVNGSLSTVGPLKVPQLGVGLAPNENATAPADIRGALVVSGPGNTGLRLSNSWDSFPDNQPNRGTICIDNNYQTMMVIGSRTGALANPDLNWPGLGRRVSVWDRLEINGHTLSTTLAVAVPPTQRPLQPLHVGGRMYLEAGVIQRGGPAITTVSELGLYSQYHAENIRLVTHAGSVRIFSDTDGGGVNLGTTPDLEVKYPGDTKARRNLAVGGNLGVGIDVPGELLHVKGVGNIGLRIQTGAGANDYAAIRFFQGDTQPHYIYTNQAGRLSITNTLSVQNGKVGIGTAQAEPQSPLEVVGELLMTRTGLVGGLKLDSQHVGWSNTDRDRGEISIDPNYKTLMLVGSVSAAIDDPTNMKWPSLGRRVSVWDRLEVNGHLLTTTQVVNGPPTMKPVQELHVNGRVYVESGVIQRGGTVVNNTADLGLYSRVAGNWIRIVTNNGPIKFFADDGAGANQRMSIEPNGDVYITGRLYPAGGVNGLISDLAVKTDITALPSALDRLLQIRGVRFNWSDPARGREAQVGVIAQEVEAVYPELVEVDRDGYRRVQYANLVAPLIEAVREQQQQISGLRAELQALRARNQA